MQAVTSVVRVSFLHKRKGQPSYDPQHPWHLRELVNHISGFLHSSFLLTSLLFISAIHRAGNASLLHTGDFEDFSKANAFVTYAFSRLYSTSTYGDCGLDQTYGNRFWVSRLFPDRSRAREPTRAHNWLEEEKEKDFSNFDLFVSNISTRSTFKTSRLSPWRSLTLYTYAACSQQQ